MRPILLCALLLGGCATNGGSADAPEAFCPGCKTMTDQTCGRCGLEPVDLDVVEETRYWCAAHTTWHEEPCANNATVQCCDEKTIRAVEVDSEAGTVLGSSCPKCMTFHGPDSPPDPGGRCARCGSALVPARGKTMTWYRCATHREWHEQPCPENSANACCSETTAELPVMID